jgi:hypothetical protein
MRLTDTEYEDAYTEALLCLADDGHAVGTPFYNSAGTRYCMVDARQLTDAAVLLLWWNSNITRQILKDR